MEARVLHRERPMRHRRLKVSRSAETLSLVLVALACPSHSTGPASDLTLALERAKEIGDHVERRLAAVAEVERLLE